MNKIIEVHRKEIILGFQQRHPDCKAISADKCDSCPEHKHLFMVGYYDFIASYQRYIHEWAIPITLLPIDHIVAVSLRLRCTRYRRCAYIRFNGKINYIYPKNNLYISSDHKRRCRVTYKFFKELSNFCRTYVSDMKSNDSCPYLKVCLSYKGKDYVFCSNPIISAYANGP